MLSIYFKKTNYMIIASPKKKTNISITTCHTEQKSQIKYLGVFIDEHLKMGVSSSVFQLIPSKKNISVSYQTVSEKISIII